MQYVPSIATVNGIVNPDTEDIVTIVSHKFHSILCGGRSVTVERIHGCKRTRNNANTGDEKFEPVVEDWHSKVALIKVQGRRKQ